jgi:cytochrome c oxidase assembly protein subunit 11
MVGLSFASVPLYETFCRITGYGGTPQTADAAPSEVFDRKVKVRFNSDIASDLPWNFKPAQHSVDVQVGESKLIFYKAENRSDKPITGMAVFNVTPPKVGEYFTKVQCFCFNEQTLEPGQTVDMPVSFFIDPAFMQDGNMRDVTSITLSYTFYNQNPASAEQTAAVQ